MSGLVRFILASLWHGFLFAVAVHVAALAGKLSGPPIAESLQVHESIPTAAIFFGVLGLKIWPDISRVAQPVPAGYRAGTVASVACCGLSGTQAFRREVPFEMPVTFITLPTPHWPLSTKTTAPVAR